MELMELREMSLQDFAEILLRRKWLVLFVFTVIFMSFVIYTNFQPRVYRASVVFKVKLYERVQPEEYVSSSRFREQTEAFDRIDDYLRMADSPTIIEKALRKIGYIKSDMDDKEVSSFVGRTRGMVSVTNVPNTFLVRVTVSGEDPQFLAALANAIFDTVKNETFDEKNRSRQDVTDFVGKTLTDVTAKLKEENERLQMLTTQGVIGTAESLQNQIAGLEANKIELLSSYTKNYPEVMALQDQIDELRGDLRALPREEFEYAKLKKDIIMDQELYGELKKKLQEAQIAAAAKIDPVILVAKATIPRVPFSPDVKANYSMGAMSGIVIAFLAAFLLEQ
ncbi:MAG: GNVR domain-containing protein, partial [Candidatus Omnitrophota bacterium]